jgi:mRNA interferase RelE/StbE
MARYSLEVSATAEKQLRRVPRADQVRILRAVAALADEPHPARCRKLATYEDVFRIRVGTYRVIYSVERSRVVVILLKIGHRKDVYR